MKSWSAIFRKELAIELRSRYALNALAMFVVTTIAIVAVATHGEELSSGLHAGMLWVIIFFAAMTGLGRTFIAEEEMGTSFFLRVYSSDGAIYTGKLLFNMVLMIALSVVTSLLFSVVAESFSVKNPGAFIAVIIAGSIALAAGSTIIAAIIARARVKGSLYPVLALPVMLPVVIVAIDATRAAAEGILFSEIASDVGVLLAYTGALVTVSFVLFESVWRE